MSLIKDKGGRWKTNDPWAQPEKGTEAVQGSAIDIYSLSAKTLEGKPAPLADYRGQVTLLVNVASEGQSDLYAALKRSTGALPSWNFGKYLIGRSGAVLKFFPSKVEPEDPELIQAVEAAIAVGA
jgi:glutathione peroxidase-family protein